METKQPAHNAPKRTPHPQPSAVEPAVLSFPSFTFNRTPQVANPREVLQLQRMIGNRAVHQIIMRQETAQEVELGVGALSEAEVEQALAFYQRPTLSARYTPEIIGQIQQVVGVPITQIMDEPTIQAIARWQFEHDLRADGIAGPQVLPIMFPSGLATDDSIESYTNAVDGLDVQWQNAPPGATPLATAQQRAADLMAIINQRLGDLGIPPLTPIVRRMRGRAVGDLNYPRWQMRLNRVLFSQAIDDPTFNDMVTTVYHEARHAEQFFRIAQMLAGRGRTPTQIHRLTQIPTDVCKLAAAQPVAPGSMEAAIAEGWYDSWYGDAAELSEVYGEAALSGDILNHAEALHEANPTARTERRVEAAHERFGRAREEYWEIPMETDTHALDERLEAAMEGAEAPEAETEIPPNPF